MLDLESFPKIDAHFHATFYDPIFENIAQKYNVRYININTDANVFPSIEQQEIVALKYVGQDADRFSIVTSFEMEGWESAGWYEKVFNHLTNALAKGAVGVKVWKNIGMELLKQDGSYLMFDDSFFDPLIHYLIANHIPLLAHLGEPKNCWMPLELMTSDRNRQYYTNHPQYHAYHNPSIPSYEKQIEARDHVLAKYPDLLFVGAHLGSLEWSYQELAKRFDCYPNFYVDLSSRLGHLQIQSALHYDEVRDFFIRYADRILYGTDAYDNHVKLENALIDDWYFLSTNRMCKSEEILDTFKGMALPGEVLSKIYFDNARKIYSRVNF